MNTSSITRNFLSFLLPSFPPYSRYLASSSAQQHSIISNNPTNLILPITTISSNLLLTPLSLDYPPKSLACSILTLIQFLGLFPPLSDISNTKEPVPIPCVNEIDECQLPTNYSYITTNAETRHMGIQRSIISLKVCMITLFFIIE